MKDERDGPAFQMYPRDWLSDERVTGLSLEGEGAYTRLLCVGWLEGGIPSDMGVLRVLLKGIPMSKLTKIWTEIGQFWQPHPTKAHRLVNPRQERVRAEQQAYRDKQSRSGAKGALSRWHGDASKVPMASDSPSPAPSPAPKGKSFTLPTEAAAPPDVTHEGLSPLALIMPAVKTYLYRKDVPRKAPNGRWSQMNDASIAKRLLKRATPEEVVTACQGLRALCEAKLLSGSFASPGDHFTLRALYNTDKSQAEDLFYQARDFALKYCPLPTGPPGPRNSEDWGEMPDPVTLSLRQATDEEDALP